MTPNAGSKPYIRIAVALAATMVVIVLAIPSSAHDHDSEVSLTTLKSFPDQAASYQEDIAPWVDRIVARYGAEEWRCVVLTHELHGHLGVLNVLGAKMGLRARELLNSPPEGLRVVSYAGLTPPLSCFNDGLQIATGATLGRGTIRVETAAPRPAARIASRTASCELQVKGAVMMQIGHDIDSLSAQYGVGSAAYFAAIRELSMRYWDSLDRHEVFTESVKPRSEQDG